MKKAYYAFVILFICAVIAAQWLVFPGRVILPQVINIVGLSVHYYGVIVALAVLVGWYVITQRIKPSSLNGNQLEYLFVILLVSGFLGARVYHVISEYDYYIVNPAEIVMLWHGGLAIYGAVISGCVALYVYNKVVLKLSFLKLLDILVPGLVLAQAIGRWGNFLNYELYGLPTNVPWKMFVPEQFRVFPFDSAQYFHPLFLYESIACLLIFWLLLRYNDLAVKWHISVRNGDVFWLWLILYGALRLGIEFLRIDAQYILGIRGNYLISSCAIIIGLYFFFIYKKHESVSAQNN